MVYPKTKFAARLSVLFLALAALLSLQAHAQQTLGAITGTVTDPSGSVVPGVTVTAVSIGTSLKRTALSSSEGTYALVNLPIGTYTLTFTRDGFSPVKFPGIAVQADRTVTLPAALKIGAASDSVTVDLNPLLNAVDTTNGNTLDTAQLENLPLPTGSVLTAATLSPGVNAELSPGTGAVAGLGNPPIWANGQRDTSNSFSLNGIDASNLFNGKSTSDVGSARVVNSTGVSTSGGAGGVIQSSASIYLSIGNSIPTPAPDSIQEVQVNASMYDAQQGSTSGAHIDMTTASGTNQYHGSLYGRRGTNAFNAAPFFFKNDDDIPANLKNPELHRYDLGGTFGGSLIKDKLFGFIAYQHLAVSDQEIGDSFLDVPVGLSDTTRTAAGFASIVNAQFPDSSRTLNASNIDPTALALFNSPALPGEPGKWLIPNDTGSSSISTTHPFDAFLPGTGRFTADQARRQPRLQRHRQRHRRVQVLLPARSRPSLPTPTPPSPASPSTSTAGAQVFSLINTYLVKSNLSTTQTLGFMREKIYMDNEQPFTPQSIPGGSLGNVSINTFGSTYFPGVSIVQRPRRHRLRRRSLHRHPQHRPQRRRPVSNTGVLPEPHSAPAPTPSGPSANTPSASASSYSYTQLNTIDKRTGTGTIATDDSQPTPRATSLPAARPPASTSAPSCRATPAATTAPTRSAATCRTSSRSRPPSLSLTAGVRYDWDGGLTEKQGRIFNFDPSLYSYNATADTITNPGFIIAGNNANGTSGVSPTTLTGRQWGIAPRVGVAWQPEMFTEQARRPLRLRHVLRSRRTLQLLLARLRHRHRHRRPLRRQPAAALRHASSCPTATLYSYYIPPAVASTLAAIPTLLPPSPPPTPPATSPTLTAGHPQPRLRQPQVV